MKIFLPFPEPQVTGIFLSRPQRFLVNVRLPMGNVTAYCANPGSFSGCLSEGAPVILWDSKDGSRARRYTWRSIKLGKTWIGTDTSFSNELVYKGICEGRITNLKGLSVLNREPRNRSGSRLDFLLGNNDEKCFVEVKSATVIQQQSARFPDSISPRSITQLENLRIIAKAGHRAVLLFLVQRGDAKNFVINPNTDPLFNSALKKALAAGVEILAIRHIVTPEGFGPPISIPIISPT